MATSFFKSAIRGAGGELGRSSMRVVLNPLLKGKDSRPIGIYKNSDINTEVKDLKLLQENVIKIHEESSLAATIVHYIFSLLLVPVFFLGLYMMICKVEDLSKPILIHTLDRPYYKVDKRSRTGYLVDKNAAIINTEEIENPGKKMLIVYKITGIIFAINVAISIILIIITLL